MPILIIMRNVIGLKLISSILLATLALSVFSVATLNNAYSAQIPYSHRDVYGYVYLKYKGYCWGVAWATIHFVKDGDELTAHSDWRGAYHIMVKPSDYKAYATLAWYSSKQIEVHVDANMRYATVNFIIEI